MLTETACVPGRNLVARNFMEVDYYWIFAGLTKNATSADAKVIGSVSVYTTKKEISHFTFGLKPLSVFNLGIFSSKMRNILLELALASRYFDYLP